MLPIAPFRETKKTLNEAKVEAAVCTYARSKGIWTRKFSSPNNRGEPDRIFIVPPTGVTFFVEFKRPGGAAKFPKNEHERNQQRKHHKIREAGGVVYLVDDIAAGKSLIDQYL